MLQSSVTQKVLYVFHILILLSGIGLVSFSVYYYLKIVEFVDLRDQNIKARENLSVIYAQPWVCFTIALFAIINSAIGLLGTKLYNKSAALCMTISSALLIAAALSMAITTNLLTWDEVDLYIEHAASEIESKRRMGIYEEWFTCCGASGWSDYGHDVPQSCCESDDLPCTSEKAKRRVGCTKIIQKYVHIVNWGLFGLAMVVCAWALGTMGVALKTYFKKKRQQKELNSSTLYGIAVAHGKSPGQTSC